MKLLADWRQALCRAWLAIHEWRRALRRKLIADAGAVAKRALSLRFIEAAALADILLNLVPYVADWLPWWLTLLLLVAAWIGRLIPQPHKEKADA
jgi:hypothetical protein